MNANRRAARARLRGFRAAAMGAMVLGALFGAAPPAQAIPMTVTSLAEFNAAIGGAPTTGDPFDNDIAGGLSITFDSGVVSTLSGGLLSNAAQDNLVSGGSFVGEVDGDGLDAPLTLTWTFAAPVVAVGLDLDIIGRLDATIVGSGQIFDIGTVIGGGSGFFGLVDTMSPFTQIQFSVVNNSRNDLFSGDNLVLAAGSLTELPEPGTLALFALGLGALAGLGCAGTARRRKS